MKGKSDKAKSGDDHPSTASDLIRKKELENSALKKILDFLEKESEVRKPIKQSKKGKKSIQ